MASAPLRLPTLFRRLVFAQALGAFALLLVFAALFYVERNRTVARLTAERWAPALREAAGLGGAGGEPPLAVRPQASAVRVADDRPRDVVRMHRWAPRIVTLRETLQDEGVPARDIAFTAGPARPLTWIAMTAGDGRMRWFGIDDDVVESHVVRRALLALSLGFIAIVAASWAVARRLAGPLEALRRRIESHGADVRTPPPDIVQASTWASTLEIDAIERAWLALRDRLDQAESERALLLAGVSHDLRGPLARIRMAAELLPETPGVAQRRGAIVRNVDVADRLIASFLDYVRATELPLETTVDLTALAERLLAMRDEPPELLALAAPGHLEVPRSHELLLERLLGNLVDNAMRHGRPPVRIHLHAEAGDAVIDVEDHGAGIAPESRARVTQAFARGDASRSAPGTGLGLAIVQQIVRRMGGTLSFESGPGGAHVVRVRLPGR